MRTAAIGGNRELTQAIIALKARLRNGRVSSGRSRQRHRPWDSTPMASRKEQKEAARQRRLAEEAAAQQKAQRNRRMQMLGGVIVAAIIVVVVLVVVSSGSGGKSSTAVIKPQSSKARSIAATVNNSLAGIPQSGTTLGNPKAKVTVTEFGDLECPICRDFALGAETQLIANQVKQGTVKIVYKSFKTATNDLADSDTIFPLQQSAAYAAGAQDKAWNYILLFYHEQQSGRSGLGPERQEVERRSVQPLLRLSGRRRRRSGDQARPAGHPVTGVLGPEEPDAVLRRRPDLRTGGVVHQAGLVSRTLRRVMFVIAVLGTALAAYLVYVHYSGAKPICTSRGDTCQKVQTSVWSKVDGVPVALIGLIGYVGILGSLLARDRDETRILTLGMTLIGVCFSGYLTYRELFTLHEICEECATSAVLMALLFIGAVWRFLITDDLAAPTSPVGPDEPARSSGRSRATV
jgi:uncharacterized membrane protein/protein-disulfide isomerase